MKPYTDCMEVREDFSAYLDGEMAAEARGPLEAHLAICADCLRELDALKRVDDSYRQLDHVPAPESFEDGVREAVRLGKIPATSGGRPVPRWMGPLVAMASAAAVLIVGVLVLEQRQNQPAPAAMQLASAPAEVQKSAAALPAAAGAPKRAPSDRLSTSANGGAAQEKKEGAWNSFAKAPASASVAPARGGREDNGSALARELAAPAEKDKKQSLDAAAESEEISADTESRARAEIIGTPPPAAPKSLAAAAPEKVLDMPKAAEEGIRGAGAPAAPAPGGAGDVVSRQTLRNFRVGADGIWYETGYNNQPRTDLKRESPALRELMKHNLGEDWKKLLGHTARQVFEIGGTWYDLEAAPEETK